MPKLAARKQWMVDHLQLRGAVVVDAGAVARKLRDEGKSLLPIGMVTEVVGSFAPRRRDRRPVGPDGAEIARGLGELFERSEARLIARRAFESQIATLLGYSATKPEMIHRDNLVLRLSRTQKQASTFAGGAADQSRRTRRITATLFVVAVYAGACPDRR